MKRERAVALAALLFGFGFVVGMDVTVCPMAGIFGLPCPSCGLTRASLALVRGDWHRAMAIHPGVVPVLTCLVVGAGLSVNRGSSARLMRWATAAGVVLTLCLTLLWAARFCGHWGGPVPVSAWWAPHVK